MTEQPVRIVTRDGSPVWIVPSKVVAIDFAEPAAGDMTDPDTKKPLPYSCIELAGRCGYYVPGHPDLIVRLLFPLQQLP